MAQERVPGTGVALGESQAPPAISQPNHSPDVVHVGVGNAENLRLPFERRLSNSLIGKLLFYMQEGPRRLVKPLAEDLRRRLSDTNHPYYLNGSLQMDSLPTYRDEQGDWKVIHEARSTGKPGLVLCVLIKPENIQAGGKFVKVVPKDTVDNYQAKQKNATPEQVPAIPSVR